MATLQTALVWSNPYSLLHVAEEPGGMLAPR